MARLAGSAGGYFLDTYAMVEYLAGNRAFQKHFEADELATSVMNLTELYYYVLSRKGEDNARTAYVAFRGFQREITEDDIARGMDLRLRTRARDGSLSYADAVGYAMSERLGVKFLTGDRAFKGLSNTEFVR